MKQSYPSPDSNYLTHAFGTRIYTAKVLGFSRAKKTFHLFAVSLSVIYRVVPLVAV